MEIAGNKAWMVTVAGCQPQTHLPWETASHCALEQICPSRLETGTEGRQLR
jgi:hypothetical protein